MKKQQRVRQKLIPFWIELKLQSCLKYKYTKSDLYSAMKNMVNNKSPDRYFSKNF